MRKLRAAYILLFQFIVVIALAQPDFTADVTDGCTPLSVIFQIDESTVDMDTIRRVDWHIGIGDSIQARRIDTTYTEEGEYTIVMVINGNRDDATIKTDYISVHRTVSAVFVPDEYESNNNFRFVPLDRITDSSATYFYLWRLTNRDGSITHREDYIINIENQLNAIDSVTLDTGAFRVELSVRDTYGCLSQYNRDIFIRPEIIVPNVYTPASGRLFTIHSRSFDTVLRFELFNRYGQNVFSQTAPVISWDGRTNQGIELNTGVYYYTLEATEGDTAEKFGQQGFIHLYR